MVVLPIYLHLDHKLCPRDSPWKMLLHKMPVFPSETAGKSDLSDEGGRTVKVHGTTLEKDNRVSFGSFE